jgi:ankyrin repeat protein
MGKMSRRRGDVGYLRQKRKHDKITTQYRKNGKVPLWMAASDGNMELVQFLMKSTQTDVNELDKDTKSTAVFISAKYGYELIVRYLVVQHKADIDIPCLRGVVAVAAAAGNGHLNIVRFLVEECNAGVNKKSNIGYTALIRAVENNHLGTVRYLTKCPQTDVNCVCNTGYSALLLAANRGNEKLVRLLATCSDIAQVTKEGDSVLWLAAFGGYESIVAYLVEECGVDAHQPNYKGSTPLYIAANQGHESVVRLLSTYDGVRTTHKNNNGNTALMTSVCCGHMNIVRFLVQECGGDVERTTNNDGLSILMVASIYGREQIARFLVEDAAADADRTCEKGLSALMYALDEGNVEIAHFLLRHSDICTVNDAIVFSEQRDKPQEVIFLKKHLRECHKCRRKEKLKKCGRCKSVFYCSLECELLLFLDIYFFTSFSSTILFLCSGQRTSWHQGHREECLSSKIQELD